MSDKMKMFKIKRLSDGRFLDGESFIGLMWGNIGNPFPENSKFVIQARENSKYYELIEQ